MSWWTLSRHTSKTLTTTYGRGSSRHRQVSGVYGCERGVRAPSRFVLEWRVCIFLTLLFAKDGPREAPRVMRNSGEEDRVEVRGDCFWRLLGNVPIEDI